MLVVELTEKDLRVLQLMIEEEIRDNEKKISRIREESSKGCYCLIDALKERNDMLSKVEDKLKNTKTLKEEN